MIPPLLRAGSALAALTMALPAMAQQSLAPAPAPDQDYHNADGPDLIVTAIIPRRQGDILAGTSIVSGAELVRDMRPTIGETLSRQPGVSSTSFGPNASRPILRGFQGERVRILTDGVGSFDVSNTSVDHAVAINPLTADRIEVMRGPSALLYGSSAIGGVVNVIDTRIPRRVPDEPVHVEGLATYGSASDERTVMGEVEAPLTQQLVVHFDGSWTKTDDLRTGGYILTKPLRQIAAQSDEAEISELANLKDRLPNTAAETWEVAGGFAFITDNGNLGVSVSHSQNRYGVPSRYEVAEEHDHADEEEGHGHEDVTLNMKQTRADMRGEVATGGGFLDSIRLRAGWATYQHQEIEPTGEVGTTFRNQSIESRLELIQANHDGWQGASGAQFFTRRFSAVGEEKFLPKNQTEQFGLFTLQSLDLGDTRLEAGARFEHSNLKADADDDLFFDGRTRSFNALSGSIGVSQTILPDWRIGLNLSRSERAPSAEELFARGNHAGTQAFELGNPDFAKEKSWGVEATLRGAGAGYSFSLAAYHNWFTDYIYEVATGAEIDELPVFQFFQSDARYLGVEGEVSTTFIDGGEGGFSLGGNLVADYVNAELGDGSAVPRIPPFRVLAGLDASQGAFGGRVEVEHAIRQTRVAAFETETPAFTLVNASLTWHPLGEQRETAIILSANNIFDVDARRHASFTKDFVPLPGRDIRLSARLSF